MCHMQWMVRLLFLLTSTVAYVQKDPSSDSQGATYVIGDLHGDVHCALQWVASTSLINNFNNNMPELDVNTRQLHIDSTDWEWADNKNTLVFMGDYIDKGPTSKQTIDFVRELTIKFPDHVTALMGNHELELLRDRDESARLWGDASNKIGYYQLGFATVHPVEYLNYLFDIEQLDWDVVNALYEASAKVYMQGLHQRVMFVSSIITNTDNTSDDDNDDDTYYKSILDFVQPASFRETVRYKLEQYQQAYLNHYKSDTVSGKWIEERPIVHLEQNVFFTHGGLRPEVSSILATSSNNDKQLNSTTNTLMKQTLATINQSFRQYANEETISQLLEKTQLGSVAYDLCTYRGNHPSYSSSGNSCPQLEASLQSLNVRRLAVGHTPSKDIKILCKGKLLALDSSLGRWYRMSGNEYCSGASHSEIYSECTFINQQCQGQISRISQQGRLVEVLDVNGVVVNRSFLDGYDRDEF